MTRKRYVIICLPLDTLPFPFGSPNDGELTSQATLEIKWPTNSIGVAFEGYINYV